MPKAKYIHLPLTVKVTLDPSPEFLASVENLKDLSKVSYWGRVMRYVIERSLLLAYETRFKFSMGKITQEPLITNKKTGQEVVPTWTADLNKLDNKIAAYQEQLSDPALPTMLRAQVVKRVKEAYQERSDHLKQKHKKLKGKANPNDVRYVRGSEGYQRIVQQLARLQLHFTPAKLKLISRNPVIFGFGNIHEMNRVRTPSYTEYQLSKARTKKHKKGLKTQSIHVELWRQFEFGTGMHKKGAKIVGPTHIADGMWRYANVQIKGSQPANFMRMLSGLPYDKDATRFQEVLQARLISALSGV